jgi:tetratricopeptide (TPR) repeat protein
MVRSWRRCVTATTIGPAIVLVTLGVAADATAADGIKVGTWVLARKPGLTLKVGAQPVAVGRDRHLFRVDRVQGDWLWLVDGGVKGWARSADVVAIDQAEAVFTAEIRRRPDAWPYLQRAAARLKRRDLNGAMADADEALRLDPKSAEAFRLRGEARLLRLRQDARADLDEAIRLDPKSAAAYVDRAKARMLQGDRDGAWADCEQAIRLDPDDPGAFIERATLQLGKGDTLHAIDDLDRALQLDPKSAGAYRARGVYWQVKRDIDRAAADFERAIELDPTDSAAYVGRAATHRVHGEIKQALADINVAIRLAPKDSNLYRMRATDRRELGNIDGALADLDEAIRLDPKAVLAYHERGSIRESRKQYDRAIADYTEAIGAEPRLAASSHERRARALRAAGRTAEAWDDLVEAIRINPGQPARFYGGYVWADASDPDRAIADFDTLIRRVPNFPFAYVGRAKAFARKGANPNARADYDEAVRLAPKDPRVLLERGTFRVWTDDLDGAFADLNEAIRLDPRNREAYVRRAETWLKSGSDRRALADLDAALRIEPFDLVALHNRAWLRCAGPDRTLHDPRGAVADATRLCELTRFKSPDELTLLATACYMAGDLKRAIQWQAKALELIPKDRPDRPKLEKNLEIFRAALPPG